MSRQNFSIMTRVFHHHHLMNSLVTFSLKKKQLVGMKWNGMDKCIRIDGVIVLTCALQFKVSDLGSAETLRHKSFFSPLPFEIMAPSFLKECRERIALLPFLVRICSTEPENFFVFDTFFFLANIKQNDLHSLSSWGWFLVELEGRKEGSKVWTLKDLHRQQEKSLAVAIVVYERMIRPFRPLFYFHSTSTRVPNRIGNIMNTNF